jgi:hypothetical protein
LAVFIFAALASIFIMLIWRMLAFRFMQKISIGMFTLGQVAAVMCSMVTFLTARPKFYEAAGLSALFYVTLGLWLLLRYALEKKGLTHLFFGCLCMALSVGCRPNFLFVSLLVPIILWERIKENRIKKKFMPMFVTAAIPYAAVGSALMWYNYIRFDSIFEFGNKYMLTVTNVGSSDLLSPMNRLILIGVCVFSFIMPNLTFGSAFPFVTIQWPQISGNYTGYLYAEHVMGILSLPIMWALGGIGHVCKYNNNYQRTITVTRRKKTMSLPFPSSRDVPAKLSPERKRILRRRRRQLIFQSLTPQPYAMTYIDKQHRLISRLIIAMPIIGFVQMIVISFIGLATRYQLDFVWLFILPALICGYFLVESMSGLYPKLSKTFGRMVCAAMIVSIIFMFILTLSSSDGNWIANHNPRLYYEFQRLLGMN